MVWLIYYDCYKKRHVKPFTKIRAAEKWIGNKVDYEVVDIAISIDGVDGYKIKLEPLNKNNIKKKDIVKVNIGKQKTLKAIDDIQKFLERFD